MLPATRIRCNACAQGNSGIRRGTIADGGHPWGGAHRGSSAKEVRGAGQMPIDRASPRSEKPPITVPKRASVWILGDRVRREAPRWLACGVEWDTEAIERTRSVGSFGSPATMGFLL